MPAVHYYLLGRDGVDEGVWNPNGLALLIVNAILIVLSISFIGLRWFVRLRVQRKLGPDDFALLACVPLTITLTVLFGFAYKNGFGLHQIQVSQDHKYSIFEYYFVIQILYILITCLCKTSILLLYMRFFKGSGKIFRWSIITTLLIVIGTCISTIVATIFQCFPIEKAWNSSVEGQCIFTGGIWYASGALAMFADVLILLLPLTQLQNWSIPRKEIIGLVALYILGVCIITITIVRFATLGPAISIQDPTWYQAQSILWLSVDLHLTIVVAATPPLRSLFSAFNSTYEKDRYQNINENHFQRYKHKINNSSLGQEKGEQSHQHRDSQFSTSSTAYCHEDYVMSIAQNRELAILHAQRIARSGRPVLVNVNRGIYYIKDQGADYFFCLSEKEPGVIKRPGGAVLSDNMREGYSYY